jgi:two-component system, OmpR family, sensor histidine kinase BaeS
MPEGIKLVFANSGEGIAEEDLPFIFERFYRGEKSRSRELGGAGLGLTIVKELVEAHGGQVGAESTPSETKIWFTLPV